MQPLSEVFPKALTTHHLHHAHAVATIHKATRQTGFQIPTAKLSDAPILMAIGDRPMRLSVLPAFQQQRPHKVGGAAAKQIMGYKDWCVGDPAMYDCGVRQAQD